MEKIREISKSNDIPISDFFAAVYGVLIGKPRGPKLFTLISVIGREKTASLLN